MNNQIKIKKANSAQANDIYNLAKTVQVNPVTAANSKSSEGFVIFVAEKQDYFKRIQTAKHFYVAMDNENVAGYIMAFTKDDLQELSSSVNYEQNVVDAVSKASNSENFIFIDHIIVSPDIKYRGQGCGKKLLKHLMQAANSDYYICACAHSPLRNQKSIGFFNANGFQNIQPDVEEEKYKLGIYRYKST